LLDNTVYGIVGIFKNLGLLAPEYYNYFYSIVTAIYIIGIIDLFTGKKIAY
jgi:hypothetical protein